LAVLFAAVAAAGVGAAGAWHLHSHFIPIERYAQLAAQTSGLERDNRQLRERIREAGEAAQGLRDELQRAGLDLEIAAVTRIELERQIVVLNEQLKQVQEELEFIKTAGGEKR
jgi:chromosome segregation ATPase